MTNEIGQYMICDGKLVYRVIDDIDRKAEREGKHTPNNNNRRIKLQAEYNKNELDKLFKG